MLELTITTRGASREKDDYHLTSQLSDEAFNAMGMAEKQLLQIDFYRPETIRCVTAGAKFGRVCPNPPPHIWAEYDNWKDNKKNLTKWWRDYKLEKCTEEIDKFARMGFSEKRYYQKHIQLMIEDQTSLFTSLTGMNRSDDSSYDDDCDGNGDSDGDGDGRRGRAVSIDGLSDLGSGNEDDALHNRVANEERAAMATVPPNAEQDDREEDAPPSSSSGWFISQEKRCKWYVDIYFILHALSDSSTNIICSLAAVVVQEDIDNTGGETS